MNKVLVKLTIPELDSSFDVFIPVNEVIWKIKKMLIKSVMDLTNSDLNLNGEFILANVDSGIIYKNNDVVISTDIRNSSELVLYSM